MRLLFGVVLGVLLTIGTAFVIDSSRPAGVDGAEVKPIVNWEVAQAKWRGLATSVQEGWNRLTGGRTI